MLDDLTVALEFIDFLRLIGIEESAEAAPGTAVGALVPLSLLVNNGRLLTRLKTMKSAFLSTLQSFDALDAFDLGVYCAGNIEGREGMKGLAEYVQFKPARPSEAWFNNLDMLYRLALRCLVTEEEWILVQYDGALLARIPRTAPLSATRMTLFERSPAALPSMALEWPDHVIFTIFGIRNSRAAARTNDAIASIQTTLRSYSR